MALRTLRSSAVFYSFVVAMGGLAAFPAGCGSQDESIFDAGSTDALPNGNTETGPGTEDTGPNIFIPSDSGPNTGVTLASLRIEPADAIVDLVLGSNTPVTNYKLFGKRTATSAEEEVNGVFQFDRIDAAAFTSTSLVPTGFVGAKGTVTAKAGGVTATTTATFRVNTSFGTAPAADVLTALDGATDADPSLTFLYPYDLTVFPRGIPGPLVQWNGASGTSTYRVIAKSETFALTAYTTGTGANGELAFPTTPVDFWSKLGDSTSGALTVSIQRYNGTKAFKPIARTWYIAGANLKGSVYYTRLVNGDSFVRRIEPGKTAEAFIQKQGEQCIACHSVSKNGERVVAGINGGASNWGVWDARTGARLFQSTQASGFQAISPNGDYVLWRHWNSGSFGSDGKLYLSPYNAETKLAELVPPGGMGAPSHPVWSPDGKTIALGMRTAGNGLNYTASTMALVDVTLAPTPAFSNFRQIVQANVTYPVASYPSFTPDSKWLGFMRANKSRGSDSNSLGELWITDVTGATQIRLDQANGMGVLTETNRAWGPSFHPVAAGGYNWVAFYAQRNWGHKFTGTTRKLWIAAVDANPVAGKDPSHPAFYVQGQELDSTNERPQFTVPPCKMSGETCESGYECCDGRFCRMDATLGKMTCQEPKANECAQIGDACKLDTDCCKASARCTGGTCQPIGPI